jgi:hypothetical protein
VKDYCKQKWKILQPYVPSSVTKQIHCLQNKLESAKLSEVGVICKSICFAGFVPELYLLA